MTKRNPISRAGAIFACLLLAACALPPLPAQPTAIPPTITVGSKDFAEQFILGEMYALLLENAGFRVERRFNLGPTETAHAALVAGDIDVYPEYTGTALLTVLGLPSNTDPAAVYDAVAKGYQNRFNLAWLAPAPANNTQAIAMTKSRAAELRIVTLSDFVTRANELSAQGTSLVLTGPPEFLTRADGLPGLQSAYGAFEVDYRPVTTGERYQQLTAEQTDAVVAFGTDGEIDGYDLATLIDDKSFFPPYQVAPVVRNTVLEANPSVRDALNPLAPVLSDDVLRGLNFQVTAEGYPATDIAKRFLIYEGLIPGNRLELPVNYIGTYRLNAMDAIGQVTGQATLTFNPDSTAAITWLSFITDTIKTETGTGTWGNSGNVVTATFDTLDGQPLQPSAMYTLTFDSHFITDVEATGSPIQAERRVYFLSSGDRNAAIRELHQRLAAIPGLGFTDPGPSNDTYDEATRQAVVAFQQSQGLLTTGIVDAETWAALKNPRTPTGTLQPAPAPTYAPVETPTPRGSARAPHNQGRSRPERGPAQVPTRAPPQPPAPAPQACTPTVTIGGDATNLRQAPSTNANVLVVLPAGTAMPAKGVNPDNTWYQVDYSGTLGWVFAELATAACMAGLPVLNVPVPVAPPAPAAPPSGQAAPPPPLGEAVIYLSYDDGPHATWTPQILQILQANNAKATFFQIGQQVAPFADIVKSQLAAGMDLGNHTWAHGSLAGVSQGDFNSVVQRTEEAQRALGAYARPGPHCLRPPYGATDGNTRPWAEALGYRVVLWTVDPQDWALPGTQQIIDHLLTHAAPGAIFLSHDGGGNRSQTVDAYRVVLPQLAAQGYKFVTNCP
jgi:osmoprotectant transport system substrate-binding protein